MSAKDLAATECDIEFLQAHMVADIIRNMSPPMFNLMPGIRSYEKRVLCHCALRSNQDNQLSVINDRQIRTNSID